MSTFRFDWRWIALIAVIFIVVSARQIPWPITAIAFAGSGGYLLWDGWRTWTRSGGAPSRSKVQYWRGQRIEVGPPRRGPALPRLKDIGPAAIYFVIGGVLLIASASIFLRQFGY